METFDVFPVSALSQRMDDFLQDAQRGRLVVITNQNRPAFLAVPFDERLLQYGINKAIALHVFEAGILTLSQAALLASVSLEDFIELLGEVGISAVDYPPEYLEEEVARACQ